MPTPMKNTGYKPPVNIPQGVKIIARSSLPATFPSSYKTDISAIPIFMQGQIPDCVENGVTFLKKYHSFLSDGVVYDLSRRFLAILTAKSDNIPFSEGTSFVTALQIEEATGIAESTTVPDDHQLNANPANLDAFLNYPISAAAYNSAKGFKSLNHVFLNDLSATGLKAAIYQNKIVLIGLQISDSWWTSVDGRTSWAANDILPIRPPKGKSDPSLSGHCIALYGYDDNYFYFVNWWSTAWGDNGLGYFGTNDMPYVYEAMMVTDRTPEQVSALNSKYKALITLLNALYASIRAKMG